jgi:hypothetical protein
MRYGLSRAWPLDHERGSALWLAIGPARVFDRPRSAYHSAGSFRGGVAVCVFVHIIGEPQGGERPTSPIHRFVPRSIHGI